MTNLAAIDPDKEEMVALSDLTERLLEKARNDLGKDELVAYDLGCGMTPAPGFKGVDWYCNADVQHDLFLGEWGFVPDGSVDVFYSSHFVEHVPDWNRFFERAWAKLRVGGLFMITTPYYLSVRATQDPDHKQMISMERYLYLSREWRELNKIDHYAAQVDFEMVIYFLAWNPDFAHLVTAQTTNPTLAEWHMKHTPNAVDDLTVVLKKK